MLYLSFIWHMHQPYYNDLLTGEAHLPWVRMHGIKDYLDMAQILEKYPDIHQTFNLVPSLLEQINAYVKGEVKDKFLELSQKRVDLLSGDERQFILHNFFMADAKRILAVHPRYYELYLQFNNKKEFSNQDILDLQVWFNLAWFDPYFRENIEGLNQLKKKARFFSEEDKAIVLGKQIEILAKIIPAHKELQDKGQIEVSLTPFYHPIMPLLCNTKIAKEANKHAHLPHHVFSYPEDCLWHIKEAVAYYRQNFGTAPVGMWPSEEAVSNHVIPLLIDSGINWIVTDEALLLKTLRKKRSHELIYSPYVIKQKKGELNILFRDKNLSDLIGFQYQHWDAEKAASDFMYHLEAINKLFKDRDCLVVIALDGENCWEYYRNDGRDFLHFLYAKISQAQFIKAVTVREYLALNPKRAELKEIAAGSWINADFSKWIGHPAKNKAWDLLCEARKILAEIDNPPELAWKQMYVLEGSDWFWWYGDKQRQFDELFRIHLKNFYKIIGRQPTVNLDEPLE